LGEQSGWRSEKVALALLNNLEHDLYLYSGFIKTIMVLQQRYLHYYFLNEVIGLSFAVWAFSGQDWFVMGTADPWLDTIPVRPRFLRAVCACFLFSFLMLFSSFWYMLFRRLRKKRDLTQTPEFDQPTFHDIDTLSRDGIKLHVQMSVPKDEAQRGNRKVMLLAQPLGQSGPSVYAPIMARYGNTFVYVTWDYRGFFGTARGAPGRLRTPSIQEHAMDGMEALRSCGFNR
jgi:hypothetical protein